MEWKVTPMGLDQVAVRRLCSGMRHSRLVSSGRDMMGNEQHLSWTWAWIRLSDTPHMRAARHWRRLGRRGRMLASRQDSHTGTKEVVYKDKTHTELPSFRSANHGYICVQRD